MTRKILGYYNETLESSGADQLVLEIGSDQVACMIKNTASQQVEGIELFGLEKGSDDWAEQLHEIRSASRFVSKGYRDIHCHYNFEEALVIPEQQFTESAAENYLELVYGESNGHDTRFDRLRSPGHINAYRIGRSLHEIVGRHFVLYKPHHSYSAILDDVLLRKHPATHFIKIQFYTGHMILVLMKDSQLQLVQSFPYQTTDDLLYYFTGITQQFGIKPASAHLEISGMFDTGSPLYPQLSKLFGGISFDTLDAGGFLAAALADHPPHFFTPFYKLAV